MYEIKEPYCLERFYLRDDGIFPNNTLPILFYKNALTLPPIFAATYIKQVFKKNHWSNAWQSGIFEYHHYHSITHEVLGVYQGGTTLLLGGEKGITIVIEEGDVLIIPAGVAHKNLNDENAVKCVGAYPNGSGYDMNYGKKRERPQTDYNISKVEMPLKDPVFGIRMESFWK